MVPEGAHATSEGIEPDVLVLDQAPAPDLVAPEVADLDGRVPEEGAPEVTVAEGEELDAEVAEAEAPELQTDPGGSEGVRACVPDDDPTLSPDELPVALGASVSYVVNAAGGTVPAPDLEGSPCAAGVCWDLRGPASAGDEVVTDTVQPVADWWFAARFPVDAVVVPMDARTGDLGVYQKGAEGLLLLGLASSEPDWTVLVYDPPVRLVALPLATGATRRPERAPAQPGRP